MSGVGTIGKRQDYRFNMQGPITKPLRIGDWRVDPASGQIARRSETARLEARTMRLLLCLAEHAGEVVSIDDLLDQVWSGVIVSPDSVYQAVTSLRRTLGDDPKRPIYIATVPRLGYRMIAVVEAWTPQATGDFSAEPAPDVPKTRSTSRATRIWWTAAVVVFVLGGAIVGLTLHRRGPVDPAPGIAQPSQSSIAVLPFLDLTEGMKDEEFADGMTEELIDKLSRIQGLRVPSATASFYFKGKSLPVAEMARQLGVLWVLDGSVRKSEGWIRVDVRLIRADNGYIAWSNTYDQPEKNILAVQDEIASAAAAALERSLGSGKSGLHGK